MKKLLLLLITVIAIGCSNDDAPAATNNPIAVTKYVVKVAIICPQGTSNQYYVTEQTYNTAKEMFENNGPCTQFIFADVDGMNHSGYLTGVSKLTSTD